MGRFPRAIAETLIRLNLLYLYTHCKFSEKFDYSVYLSDLQILSMKQLFIILLFLSVGAQAQVKKHGGKKIEKRTVLKKKKKSIAKNFRDKEEKRIIDLSQQNDGPRKEIVKKSSASKTESFDYEETRSSRARLYLFI